MIPGTHTNADVVNWTLQGFPKSQYRVRFPAPAPWAFSSVGRAFVWHTKGRGFDPPKVHHLMAENTSGKASMISANGGQIVCPHGSLYCRRCYGEKVSNFSKAQHVSHKRKNK